MGNSEGTLVEYFDCATAFCFHSMKFNIFDAGLRAILLFKIAYYSICSYN